MQLPRKMSAQNVMASISRTLGTRSDSKSAAAPNEVKFAGEESKDKLYEPKHKQKLVRVLTVVAYVISVSLAAIILSLYYMFLWDPRDRSYYIQRANKPTLTSSNRLECRNLSNTAPGAPTMNNRQYPEIRNNVTIGPGVTTEESTTQTATPASGILDLYDNLNSSSMGSLRNNPHDSGFQPKKEDPEGKERKIVAEKGAIERKEQVDQHHRGSPTPSFEERVHYADENARDILKNRK